MLIVGAYPNTFWPSGSVKPLQALARFTAEWLPREILLHVLPFGPACGDGGFALTSWTDVRSDFGSWADIETIARQRYVLVDAVYNHVGVKHPIFVSFLQDPRPYEGLFYAFQTEAFIESPETPRGGKALREWPIAGERWLLWQTFTVDAVDIRIDAPQIRELIHDHLRVIKSHGVKGVRLDAPAYFGKVLSGPIRHNSESYRLARLAGDLIRDCGLDLTAQLDCDPPAREYFPPNSDRPVPIVDFSFSAQLALAIVTQNPEHLREHLAATWCIPNVLMRTPRTHDGMLMKSDYISGEARGALVDAAMARGITPRIINGFPYELNCSLPHLYGALASDDVRRQRLQLAIAVAAFVPGIAYLYLPAIMDFIPENLYQHTADPRALNRQPMPESHRDWFLRSTWATEQANLLRELSAWSIGPGSSDARQSDRLVIVEGAGLVMSRADVGLSMAANFSSEKRLVVPASLAAGAREADRHLEPLKFAIWRSSGA